MPEINHKIYPIGFGTIEGELEQANIIYTQANSKLFNPTALFFFFLALIAGAFFLLGYGLTFGRNINFEFVCLYLVVLFVLLSSFCVLSRSNGRILESKNFIEISDWFLLRKEVLKMAVMFNNRIKRMNTQIEISAKVRSEKYLDYFLEIRADIFSALRYSAEMKKEQQERGVLICDQAKREKVEKILATHSAFFEKNKNT